MRFRLVVQPIVLGGGKPLFKDVNQRHALNASRGETPESGRGPAELSRAQGIWDAITSPEWTVKYGYQGAVEYSWARRRVPGALDSRHAGDGQLLIALILSTWRTPQLASA